MQETIYLAGGCFWGVEAFFKKLAGIKETTCGYANSTKEAISYEEVCSGKYKAAECVEICYDAQQITLPQILHAFFAIIDPTSLNQQGGDIGIQYRTGIYYTQQSQVEEITEILEEIKAQYAQEIVTEVQPLTNFYPAESYHQDYLDKNPNGYCHINLAKAHQCMKALGIALKS